MQNTRFGLATAICVFITVFSWAGYCRAQAEEVRLSVLADHFPDIYLYATILDTSGNPVTGLSSDSFTIKEQSETDYAFVSQPVTYFKTLPESAPVSVALAVDTGWHMSGDSFYQVKDAVGNFLLALSPDDRASVVAASGGSNGMILYPPAFIHTDNDKDGGYDIIASVYNMTPGGESLVFDAAAKAVESTSQEPVPKAVVLISGGENVYGMHHSADSVIRFARQRNVPIYTIGIGASPSGLQAIATETGGKFFHAPAPADLNAILLTVSRYIRPGYVLGYRSHNSAFDGTLRYASLANGGGASTIPYYVNSRPKIEISSVSAGLPGTIQEAGAPIPVSGSIMDMDAYTRPEQTLSANLFFRQSGTDAYSIKPMTLIYKGSGKYSFGETISSGVVKDPGVEYFIQAYDSITETIYPGQYNMLPVSISVQENQPPVIEHFPVESMALHTPIHVAANVYDNDGGCIRRVKLFYRTKDTLQNRPFIPSPMVSENCMNFAATIPAGAMTGEGVEYFISAWDNCRVRTDLGSSAMPFYISPPDFTRVSGTITVDNKILTQFTDSGYRVSVTRPDGSGFSPAANDTDGLNASGLYQVDVPLFHETIQTGGAFPGSEVTIRVFLNDAELEVLYPKNGRIVLGYAGDNTIANLLVRVPEWPDWEKCPGCEDEEDHACFVRNMAHSPALLHLAAFCVLVLARGIFCLINGNGCRNRKRCFDP